MTDSGSVHETATTAQPPAPVLLIDLSSIAHPIWHTSGQEPDPDHTSQRTAAAVRKLAADHPHTAICCDSRSNFRKQLDSTYKANRPAADAALHHQIDLAREALGADGFPVWRVDGFEGDDLIATAAHKLIGSKVLIASADKDLLALVSDRVEVHSTRTGNRLGPLEVKEKLGVEPCQVEDYLSLVGDASDNIAGARGIGPKTAIGLLKIHDTLDGVYRVIDSGDAPLLPSQLASLEELRPRLDNVRALVHMRTDVPLDVESVFEPRVPTVVGTFMEGEGEVEMKTLQDHAQEMLGGGTASPMIDTLHTETDTVAPEPEAIAVVKPELVEQPEPVEWERGLEPRSMHEACLLAKRLHDSKLFSGYGSPQSVLSTILLGRELGLPAMASLRSVHIIEGKHSLSAELMVALVLKSGLAEYFQLVESTDVICTFETQRKGAPEPQRLSYTIEQAQQAGLTRGNWQKIPRQMLRARAKSELARLEYPDLLAGLYTPDELRDV